MLWFHQSETAGNLARFLRLLVSLLCSFCQAHEPEAMELYMFTARLVPTGLAHLHLDFILKCSLKRQLQKSLPARLCRHRQDKAHVIIGVSIPDRRPRLVVGCGAWPLIGAHDILPSVRRRGKILKSWSHNPWKASDLFTQRFPDKRQGTQVQLRALPGDQQTASMFSAELWSNPGPQPWCNHFIAISD